MPKYRCAVINEVGVVFGGKDVLVEAEGVVEAAFGFFRAWGEFPTEVVWVPEGMEQWGAGKIWRGDPREVLQAQLDMAQDRIRRQEESLRKLHAEVRELREGEGEEGEEGGKILRDAWAASVEKVGRQASHIRGLEKKVRVREEHLEAAERCYRKLLGYMGKLVTNTSSVAESVNKQWREEVWDGGRVEAEAQAGVEEARKWAKWAEQTRPEHEVGRVKEEERKLLRDEPEDEFWEEEDWNEQEE